MTIRRGKHKSRFTIIPNVVVEDDRLSAATKGTQCYLLSRPPGWSVKHEHLRKTMKLGRAAFRRVMRELIEAGYVRRSDEQQRAVDNTFLGYDYDVFDTPQAMENGESVVRFPSAGSRQRKLDNGSKEERKQNTNLQTATSEVQYSDAAIADAQYSGQPKDAGRETVPAPKPCASNIVPAKRIAEGTERVHARIAERLGQRGWAILQSISASELDQLTAQERRGCLGKRVLDDLRLRDRYPAAFDGRAAL